MRFTDEFLDGLRLQADPVADGIVNRVAENAGEAQSKAMFEVLVRNLHLPYDQLPAEVKTFMDEHAVLPAWADPQLLKRGSAVFLDHGLAFAVVLYFRSLPETYLISSISKVLFLTGKLSGRDWPASYARRVGETTQFVIDVMTDKGFEAGGISFETLLKVRLVHASIRHFTHALPEWDNSGPLPINQEDLSYTLMTFALSMLEGLEKMGIRLSMEDEVAYFHHWRVAGHVMGIQADALPVDIAEGRILMKRVTERGAADTEAGRACTSALIAFSQDMLAGNVLDTLPASMVRFMVGDAHADLLGVKSNLGCVAKAMPIALLKLLGLSERIEDRYPQVAALSNKLGAAILKGMRKRFNSYKGHGLRIPPEMEKAWQI